MINHTGTKSDLDPFDSIEEQKSQFTVKTVESNNILETAVRFKKMIDFIRLHWPPITRKSIITDVVEIMFSKRLISCEQASACYLSKFRTEIIRISSRQYFQQLL
jgi:hypothetical protein